MKSPVIVAILLIPALANLSQAAQADEPPRESQGAEIPKDAPPPDILPYTKESAAHAASLLNVLAGAAAFVAGVCQVACGPAPLLISGAAWLASGVANHAAIDSGRDDYRFIMSMDIPRPDLDLSGIPPDLQNLISELSQAKVLLEAIYVTSNRAAAAAKDNSTEWAQKQMSALLAYQARLDPLLTDIKAKLAAYPQSAYPWISQATAALSSYQGEASTIYGRIYAELKSWENWAVGKTPERQ